MIKICFTLKNFPLSMQSSQSKIVETLQSKYHEKNISLSQISSKYVTHSQKNNGNYKLNMIKNHVTLVKFIFLCGPQIPKQWKIYMIKMPAYLRNFLLVCAPHREKQWKLQGKHQNSCHYPKFHLTMGYSHSKIVETVHVKHDKNLC